MQESGHLAARRLTGRVGSPQRPSPPEALLFLLLIHQPPAESPTEENNHTHTRVTPPHVHTTDSVSLPPRTEKCSLLTRTPGSSGPQCPEPDPDPGPARTGHEGAVPCIWFRRIGLTDSPNAWNFFFAARARESLRRERTKEPTRKVFFLFFFAPLSPPAAPPLSPGTPARSHRAHVTRGRSRSQEEDAQWWKGE